MAESIDIHEWRRDGERLWNEIQESKLVVIFWNNPWFRFAVIALAVAAAAVVTWFVWRNHVVSGGIGVVSALAAYTALKYWRIGMQTGGLYSFFSEKGFGIGCDADRLCFPYSSIRLQEWVSPSTVNQNFIVLPVLVQKEGVTLERKDGTDSEWDGMPYQRGIASVLIKDGVVRVEAYPNEMIVHLFCAIYPLSMYLDSRSAEPNTATGAVPPQG